MGIDWKALIGFSALTAMLVLLSPGVTVVRAEILADEEQTASGEAPQDRQVDASDAAVPVAKRALRASDRHPSKGIIVLNTRPLV